MRIARFIGDPTGYCIHPDDGPADVWNPEFSWVRAEVGQTGRWVRINLDFAYVIEHVDESCA